MHDVRLAIAPTVDFDGISVPVIEGLSRTWLSAAEFGATTGLPRMLDWLRERAWTTTFFVPGHTIDTYPELCQRLVDDGHEIGHHGHCHEDPSIASEADERRWLEAGIERITRIAGAPPVGYRAPYFRSSWRTQSLLAEYGFEYDSSLMAGDFRPYRHRAAEDPAGVETGRAYRFGPPDDLVEVPVSWHLDDWPLYDMPKAGQGPLKAPDEVARLWQSEFDYAYERVPGGLLTLTLHPEVSGRGGRVAGLERLLDGWMALAGVSVVRLVDYVRAWRERHPPEVNAPSPARPSAGSS